MADQRRAFGLQPDRNVGTGESRTGVADIGGFRHSDTVAVTFDGIDV